MKDKKEAKDSRYPYTYACDFIRSLVDYNEHGTKLSRSDASNIRSTIAKIIGMDDEELACKLANQELAKTDEDFERQAQEFLKVLERRG